METGSTSKSRGKAERVKGGGTTRLSSMLQKIEPFMPRIDHNPNELRSWAKRTGFVSDYSGGTQASASEKNDSALFDLEKGLDSINGGSSPKIEIDPVLGRTKPNRGIEIEPVVKNERDGTGRGEDQSRRTGDEAKVDERKVGSNGSVHRNGNGNVNGIANANGNGHGNEVPAVAPTVEPKKDDSLAERDAKLDFPYGEEPAPGGWHRPSGLKCGLRENPGFVPLIYYGLQHYLSLAGSLIFIPSIIVPAMGGTDKDIATVISTMLLVSGVTTILHSYFGTRLPLVQGSSYVYLAPALVIMNAREYRDLTEHAHNEGTARGNNRWFNISEHFGIQWLDVPFFKYLRGISIFGHRVFRIYAVPLSIMIIWTYAFFLTAGGAYNYKGCSPDIPSSNILIDACRKHAYTMKHCRTDVSNAWRAAAWVRIPYPLQWGIPIFHLRTSLIMIIVSLVASVDSVGTYHSASVRVNSKPPSPGIVSRGIAMEGFCSILAGLWGSGTGSTTLTENVHTIDITKVASRRAVEVGAVFLILFSFVGKVGAILASIPQALAASVLCFMWALIVALGLSTLQYSQTASFRNITVVGVSLFLGLSIPAYFQQYQPESSLILPSYFVPYAAASSGPVYTGSKQLDFALNAILSLNMVVTLLVAFVLDNTVPGSRQERGVYIWSRAEEIANDPSLLSDYALPRKVAKCFYWARCLGV
ncbi:hypothetical protein F2P56_024068 [Juglans regia]|uniref:Nucleobase-ascorbate transporter 11 n=1 Tax=Juglans regia TaxID=51240 RepID=A0A833U6F7_JUGRE|nr:hypothetical protein F2P56_024068 [Juglans regia]